MASGSSGGRNSSVSKGFDFASDDILCSYDDFANQEGVNGAHSDPSSNSANKQEFHKSRMARSSVFPASSYSPPEESMNQDVLVAVERSMKKYSDNLMRFLEGLSSRMSQLELYCYNLDKSIGEMRSDLVRDHGEADTKLKSLEKHLQEVHRSVQILRDKQELAETQKELAKLQLAQKESSPSSQKSDGRSSPEPQKSDNTADSHGQQLALALPHQVAPQPTLPTRPAELPQPAAPQPPMPSQALTQPQAYYLPPTQLPSLPAPPQHSQGQYLPADSQYRTQPQATQSQVNQPQPQLQGPPQYQQQWTQQLPQQVQPPQQSMQLPQQPPQVRPSTPVYPTYLPNQPANPSPQEILPSSMPMQMSFSGIPQSSSSQSMQYGYGGPGRTMQQQPPPQHLKASFGGQAGDGYAATGPGGPHPTLSPGTYMMYESEGGRSQHQTQPPHFQQTSFPPNPQQSGANVMVRPSQFMRNHPYNELMDKLVSMGYRGGHVMSVIQRLEESGQPVDFNAVLDRLNVQSSGSSQRGWSG